MNEARKQLQPKTTNYEEHLPNIMGMDGVEEALNADNASLDLRQGSIFLLSEAAPKKSNQWSLLREEVKDMNERRNGDCSLRDIGAFEAKQIFRFALSEFWDKFL